MDLRRLAQPMRNLHRAFRLHVGLARLGAVRLRAERFASAPMHLTRRRPLPREVIEVT